MTNLSRKPNHKIYGMRLIEVPATVDGKAVEGSFRSHQVPLAKPFTDPNERRLLEEVDRGVLEAVAVEVGADDPAFDFSLVGERDRDIELAPARGAGRAGPPNGPLGARVSTTRQRGTV